MATAVTRATPVVEALIQFESEPELFPPSIMLLSPWATAGEIERRRTLRLPCAGGCGERADLAYHDRLTQRWLDVCYRCGSEVLTVVNDIG